MKTLKTKSVKQRTLTQAISYVGIGLHTGKKVKMTVKPADIDSGINFLRTDVHTADNIIPAHWYNVVDTTLSTVIANKDNIKVGTIEHLMADLKYGCNTIIDPLAEAITENTSWPKTGINTTRPVNRIRPVNARKMNTVATYQCRMRSISLKRSK